MTITVLMKNGTKLGPFNYLSRLWHEKQQKGGFPVYCLEDEEIDFDAVYRKMQDKGEKDIIFKKELHTAVVLNKKDILAIEYIGFK